MPHFDARLPLFVCLTLAPAACGLFGGSDDDGAGFGDSSGCGAGECADSGDTTPSTGCPAIDGANGSGTLWDHIESYTTDIHMTAAGSPHIVNGPINVWDFTVDIEPCAVVLFENGGSLDAIADGRVVAHGTADAPILFDAVDPAVPGGGLTTGLHVALHGGYLDLAHVIIRNAGGGLYPAAIHLQDSEIADAPAVRATLQSVTIEDSAAHGLETVDGAVLDPASSDLTIRNAALQPIASDTLIAGHLVPGDYQDNPHPAVLLVNGYFAIPDEIVLHDLGLPYELGSDDPLEQFSLDLSTSASGAPTTLRIEPGVELRFGHGQGISAHDDVTLDFRGTADAPIVLTSLQPSPAAGDWIGVAFLGAVNPNSQLDHVEIAHAGADVYVPGWYHCNATDIDDHTEAAALLFTQEPHAGILTDSSIHHSSAHGINRAWQGADIDVRADNVISDIVGCEQTTAVPVDGECPATVLCGG